MINKMSRLGFMQENGVNRRYLPSAFDNSLDIYETLSNMREYLNRVILIVNEQNDKLDEFFKTIDGEIRDYTVEQINKMMEDGTIEAWAEKLVLQSLKDRKNIEEFREVSNTDTEMLLKAFDWCVKNDTILVLNPYKTYVFEGDQIYSLPFIEGRGAKIRLTKNCMFNVRGWNQLRWDIMQVWDNAIIPDQAWFNVDNMQNVMFNETEIVVQANQSGSRRTKVLLRARNVENVTVTSFKANGSRMGLDWLDKCRNIYMDRISLENMETGIHAKASLTNVTGGIYTYGVYINNYKYTNTADQQGNYQLHKGADGILLEKCKKIFVTNAHVERAPERAFYNSCNEDLYINNFVMQDVMGIKFAGNLRYDLQLNNIAKRCMAMNIENYTTNYPETHLFETYDAEEIVITGGLYDGNKIGHAGILTQRFVKNLVVEDVTVLNTKRSFFEYVHWGDRPGVPELGIPPQLEKDYLALLESMTIQNCTARSINNVGYEVFRFVNYGSIPEPQAWRFKGLNFLNNNIDNTNGFYDVFNEVTGTSNPTLCTGLISIDAVTNLRMEGNMLKGFKGTLVNDLPVQVPYQIGNNTLQVTIKHNDTIRNVNAKKVHFGTLWISPSSEFNFKGFDRLKQRDEVFRYIPKTNTSNPTQTVNMRTDHILSGEITTNLSGNDVVNIVGFDNSNLPNIKYTGRVDVTTGRGEYGLYVIASTDLSSKKNVSDDVFAQIITSGKIALVKDATMPRFILRDQTAQSTRATITYLLSSL